ncbi:beta-lactamase/transpeptidase-like protein [Aspergillus egyptiacus]|nr:beta-lactamase/transpeptidase-like protein [Aspergillus egyptiacus]
MATVHGQCDPRFTAVRDIFASHLQSGAELGASIHLTQNGKALIDLWGGHTTPSKRTPWEKDTLVVVWSISKTISALAVLLLIDRGQLTPDTPLADFWPAFNTPDKRGVLVRHVLAHTAGLPSWDPPITQEELYDIPLSTDRLVSQKPWWEPGTKSGYHLISQGILIGGIVERVTGKSLAEFVAGEFSGPLGADFHMGMQDEGGHGRIAELVPPPPLPAELFEAGKGAAGEANIALRAMVGCRLRAEYAATPEFRKCGIGSMGGISNARGFNKILEIITHRGMVDGRQFLRPETVDLVFRPQAEGRDLVLGIPLKMGMGFGLMNGAMEWMPRGQVCFWGGWGGSIALMDLERRVTFTYAMNKMELGTLGNSRATDYIKAVYEVLESQKDPGVQSNL